jgi:hypothetical protein
MRARTRLFVIAAWIASTFVPAVSFGQNTAGGNPPPADAVAQPDPSASDEGSMSDAPKRLFGIIPNYRTSPTLADYQPLTAGNKFKVAADDALDRGTFALAALFAVDAQLTTAAPSFGHGIRAYPHYYVAALGDFVIADVMTEGLYPAMLRQDPRYFRKGTGSGLARLGYAVGQIFWTHTDSGGTQINLSEIVGNATAVGIGNAYYPDNRTLSNNVSKLCIQIGVDLAANILKEFAPDLDRLFSRPPPSKDRRH